MIGHKVQYQSYGQEIELPPDFIIIGGMKCGTTSLHYYLDLHPEIAMSEPKEPNFFVPELNGELSLSWYQSLFSDQAKKRGEASTAYTMYPTYKGVPQRIYTVLPHAKLIYIVRDPLERIVSHYVHEYARGRANGSLDEELARNDNYINFSKYYMQLEQYLAYYQDYRILIITLDSLKNHRQITLQKVFEFLEVDTSFRCSEYSKVLFRSSDRVRRHPLRRLLSKLPGITQVKSKLSSSLVLLLDRYTLSKVEKPILTRGLSQRLVENLYDDTMRLRQYTGYGFADWCV